MKVTKAVGTSALAAGIAMAGLLGVGAGAAAAEPGPACGRSGTPACAPTDRAPGDWQRRGPDQARQDHRPFNWQGHQVTPMRAGNGDGWGFWFLGQWIRL
ncbi:hypothetical protein NIIDNTM18_23210 [Mycolicibacterium litorale]|uniref:Uncharacterized protein n=1 Tax=Mycolicibacterium litorale TaxID=758802 RepID=A0A6S6NZT2_9MYCO|nr:hypothetical protein [Mycolicibacterium litorale]BCI53043.1 hypothetical protein NIIDNTM18_23210 [Mycolicibacterium litorale]